MYSESEDEIERRKMRIKELDEIIAEKEYYLNQLEYHDPTFSELLDVKPTPTNDLKQRLEELKNKRDRFIIDSKEQEQEESEEEMLKVNYVNSSYFNKINGLIKDSPSPIKH